MKKEFEVRDPATGEVRDIDVASIDEDIIYPLKAYLGELPAYDITLDWNQQKTEEPSRQHGFAVFYFTRTFELLGVSLGHIFKVQQSDVDMRDIVLNRRILVVNLPALESSDPRLASLGKIVVASLRGMMAQMLGSRLEGDYSEIVANKPGMSAAPFHVVLDEVAHYATSGMDRMLAMGRGLNFMFWLGFQEVSGIWARLGEKTQSLLGNANLTVAMRQQDANRTRQWIEDTAGKTYVSQASGYEGGGAGEYSESQHAELREVSRVDWNDLQRLIEGEAIVLFGGRRIYAKLFHAVIDTSGPLRLNRPLPLPAPYPETIKSRLRPDRCAQVRDRAGRRRWRPALSSVRGAPSDDGGLWRCRSQWSKRGCVRRGCNRGCWRRQGLHPYGAGRKPYAFLGDAAGRIERCRDRTTQPPARDNARRSRRFGDIGRDRVLGRWGR